jgi:hypothetical protein
MIVVQGVEDHAAAAAGADEAQAAQQAQLVRDGGVARADQFRQLADAEFATGEGVEQADASGVAEDREGGGQRRRGAVADQRRPHLLHRVRRHLLQLADFFVSLNNFHFLNI